MSYAGFHIAVILLSYTTSFIFRQKASTLQQKNPQFMGKEAEEI